MALPTLSATSEVKESNRVHWADLNDAQRRDIMMKVATAVFMVFFAVACFSGMVTLSTIILPVGLCLIPVTMFVAFFAGSFVKDAVDTVRKHMYPKSFEEYESIE